MRYVSIPKGGTLSKIAQQEHIPLKALLFTNANLDPRRIQIGQKIAIPETEDDLLAVAEVHKERIHKTIENKPEKEVGNEPKRRCECKVDIKIARIKAFMRMLRIGEGTKGNKGYETLFGGKSFIKDFHKSYKDHPKIHMPFGKTTSTAAGAYQIMSYTWDDKSLAKYKRKYHITSFVPINQDKFAIVLLKYKHKNGWKALLNGNINNALNSYSYEWASLPPGRYGQPTQTKKEAIKHFNKFLKEECQQQSDLKIDNNTVEKMIND